MKGTMVAKHMGGSKKRTDKYEYTRRREKEKAQMNLDKIFISKFKNIKINDICDHYGISINQARSLNLNAKDIHIIKTEIDRQIREMYDIKSYEGYDLSKHYSYFRWSKKKNEQVEKGERILLKRNYYED